MRTLAIFAAINLAAAVPAPAQQSTPAPSAGTQDHGSMQGMSGMKGKKGSDMSGMTMDQQMAHCAEMREQMKQGKPMSSDMQQMMKQCDDMDRQMQMPAGTKSR
jgi:hypothetical protein